MPRRLLRDGRPVDDEWLYLGESADAGATPRWIVPADRWLARAAGTEAIGGPLGVLLQPEHSLEGLVEHLERFELIALHFPGPADGRSYSHARLLRERHGFRGELRATGHVRLDQLFFMARCGINAFEVPERELETAVAALGTFSAAYQASNDAGFRKPLEPVRFG